MAEKALFITTKNLDYLRNTQEIRLLREAGYEVRVIGSAKKSYPGRLLSVYREVLFSSSGGYDVVFVGFSPQLVVPFFKWKWKRSILVIDFFISMYDTLVFDRKKVKENSWLAGLLKKWDRNTIKAADRVIADTRAHGAYFMQELGLLESRLTVLYLEADKSIYKKMRADKPEEWKDKFLVLYFGSILPLQGVDIVLKSAKILKEHKDIHFCIIGPVKEEMKLQETGTATYIPWLSQTELAEKIAMADLCLAGHFSGSIAKAGRTIPGKAYIYHAMGKPMVLGDSPANHELFSEESPGISFVEMGNPQRLAEEILSIKEKLVMHEKDVQDWRLG